MKYVLLVLALFATQARATSPCIWAGTYAKCLTSAGIWIPNGGVKFPDNSIQTTAATAASIGGTITGGTTGSVLFVGPGPVFAQDNTKLFWDTTKKALGIGTNTPAVNVDTPSAAFIDITSPNDATLDFHGGGTPQEGSISADGAGLFFSVAGAATAAGNNRIYFMTGDADANYTVHPRMVVDTNNGVLVGDGTTTAQSNIASANHFLDVTASVTSAVALHSTLAGSTQEGSLAMSGQGLFLDVAGAATATDNFISFRTRNTASNYNAQERMRLTSAGDLGFGTTTPVANIVGGTMIDVTGVGTGTLTEHAQGLPQELSIATNGTSGAYFDVAGAAVAANNNRIHFRTGQSDANFAATERMLVDTNGGILIGDGTTTALSNIASASHFLDVTSPVTSAVTLHSSLAGSTQEGSLGMSGQGLFLDVAGSATAADNFIAFRTRNTASNFNATERMRLTSAGNLGFGTTTPVANINGGTMVDVTGVNSGTLTAHAQGLPQELSLATTGGGVYFDVAGAATALGNNDLIFRTENTDNQYTPTERMRIISTGNVGIGTPTPTSLFSVGSTSQFQVDTNGDAVKLKNVTYSWPSSQASGTKLLQNDGSGNLTWGSGTFSVSTISGNTTAVSGTTYFADTSGAPFTLTLPTPAAGAFVFVKDKTGSFNTNNLTVAQHAAEKIEGVAASKILQTAWGTAGFISDGTDWFIGGF